MDCLIHLTWRQLLRYLHTARIIMLLITVSIVTTFMLLVRVLGFDIFIQNTQQTSVVPKIKSAKKTRSSENPAIPKVAAPRSKTSTHQRSLLIRTTRVWNSLADELKLKVTNLNSMKSFIRNYSFCTIKTNYDPTKCNTARTLAHPLMCCY